MSFAATFACSMAARAARAAMSLVYSSLAAMRRSLMPVRVVIHSSVVLTDFESSAFVSTRSGT